MCLSKRDIISGSNSSDKAVAEDDDGVAAEAEAEADDGYVFDEEDAAATGL